MPRLMELTRFGYQAVTASICGDVRVGRDCNFWFGVVLRGDVAPITLGDGVNLQDGVIVHCDFDVPQEIHDHVVVGHGAILHGKIIERGALIGIGARLLSGTVVGEESIIAAGSVVPPGMIIPKRSMVMGIPGKVVRNVRVDEIATIEKINLRYQELARNYVDGTIE